jgi:hypothetical protein
MRWSSHERHEGESPRPDRDRSETRDIVQNIYIRKVEKVDGELYNMEFATFEAVKDPARPKVCRSSPAPLAPRSLLPPCPGHKREARLCSSDPGIHVLLECDL